MSFQYSRLVEIITLPNSVGAIYTNAANTISYLRLIVIHNSNTIIETVKLYNVPDSGGSPGTPGDTNKFYQEDISPYATRIIEFTVPGLMLVDTNDTLQGYTTTASKVSIQIMGAKE